MLYRNLSTKFDIYTLYNSWEPGVQTDARRMYVDQSAALVIHTIRRPFSKCIKNYNDRKREKFPFSFSYLFHFRNSFSHS